VHPALGRLMAEGEGVHVACARPEVVEDRPLRDRQRFVVFGVVHIEDAVDPVAVAERRVLVGALPEVDHPGDVGERRGGERHLTEVPRPGRRIDAHLVGADDPIELVEIREAPRPRRGHGVPARREGAVSLHDRPVGSDDGDGVRGGRREPAAAEDDDLLGRVVGLVAGHGRRVRARDAEGKEERERVDADVSSAGSLHTVPPAMFGAPGPAPESSRVGFAGRLSDDSRLIQRMRWRRAQPATRPSRMAYRTRSATDRASIFRMAFDRCVLMVATLT